MISTSSVDNDDGTLSSVLSSVAMAMTGGSTTSIVLLAALLLLRPELLVIDDDWGRERSLNIVKAMRPKGGRQRILDLCTCGCGFASAVGRRAVCDVDVDADDAKRLSLNGRLPLMLSLDGWVASDHRTLPPNRRLASHTSASAAAA
jgi:hypothetical protein